MASEFDGNKVLWFLTGVAVGAAIGLLYAPQSGRNTRKYIRNKTDEGREALTDAGKDLFERGREVYNTGRRIAEEAGDLVERGRKLVTG